MVDQDIEPVRWPEFRVTGVLRLTLSTWFSLLCVLPALGAGAARAQDQPSLEGMGRLVNLRLYPSESVLDGHEARQTITAIATDVNGVEWDVTEQASLEFKTRNVARRDADGRIYGLANGGTAVDVDFGPVSTSGTVIVKNLAGRRSLSFVRDVVPVLTRGGCAGSNCHGSVRGKNGFKLSLFGFEPEADYEAITTAGEGRRVNFETPEQSLILLKPTFTIAHGGGVRFEKQSPEYETLLEWLKQNAPFERESPQRIASLHVYPDERVLVGINSTQQLVATASFEDGTREDATLKVQYSTGNDRVAEVSKRGRLIATGPGETTVMVRMLGKAVAVRVAVVEDPPMADYPEVARNNFIDEFVFSKLERLNIIPSQLSTDEEFVRRVYLDTIGLLPTIEEARSFLTSEDPHKRAALIDELLERQEFNDVWAINFSDIFRIRSGTMAQGTRRGHRWIRQALVSRKPYDQLAREMVTGQGMLYWDGAPNFYAIGSQNEPPDTYAVNVSQTLLGVRLECAKCHNHPFERWSQDDFWGFTAFFSRIKQKEVYFANEMSIFLKQRGEVLHPNTKEPVKPKFLDGAVVEEKQDEDIREELADWITDPKNPWFARTAVNRIWKYYMGRGLVEPVDDFRVTNPAGNPELLDALEAYFIEHEFGLRAPIRAILNSRTYQLSSEANETNRGDEINHSRYYIRRLGAEHILDAVSQSTGVPDKFPGYPPGVRAMEIPEGSPSYFLKVLGRAEGADKIQERDLAVDLSQILHLINGDTLQKKIGSEKGVLRHWLADKTVSDSEVLDRIYLATLSRYPTTDESEYVATLINESPDERAGIFEDVYWSIFNSNEFFFNH